MKKDRFILNRYFIRTCWTKLSLYIFSFCSSEDFILVLDLMDGSSWFSITIDGTDHKWKICETIILFLWDPLQYTMFINKLVAKQEVISYDQRHSGRKIILLTKDVCFWNSHWLQKAALEPWQPLQGFLSWVRGQRVREKTQSTPGWLNDNSFQFNN